MSDLMTGKIEMRMAGAIVFIGLALVFAFVGDQATFRRPPQNGAETVLTVVPVMTYLFIEDRTTCFVTAFCVYTCAIGVSGLLILSFLQYQVFEPFMFKRMAETKKREEALFNKYVDESNL